MRGLVGIGVVLGVAACSAVAGPPDSTSAATAASGELSLPLDAKTLAAQLTARGIRTKADALAILPHAMKQRFVLVKNTGALGKASPDRPRAIHFAEDGRFIVASSGHKLTDDATANSLEILEEDPATQTYHMHTITVDASGVKLIADDDRCTGCHGTPARPIWGSYPSWPAAYGEQDDRMSPDELASFATFTAMAPNDPDYRHLEIHTTPRGFYLPTPYGYPNTAFTEVVGNRWALQLANRMLANARLPRLEHALVAAELQCPDAPAVTAFVDQLYAANLPPADATYPTTRLSVRIFRLLGIEPTVDFHLETPVIDSPPEGDDNPTNSGFDVGDDYLHNVATTAIMTRVVRNDPTLTSLFAPVQARLDAYDQVTRKADSVAFEALTTTTTPTYEQAVMPAIYWDLQEPVLKTSSAQVCARLAALQIAAQAP